MSNKNQQRQRRIKMDWLKLFTAGVIIFLFLPVVLIVLFSFHNTPSLSFPFLGFSLRWYREIFNRSDLLPALKNSFIVATVTAVVSAVLGILAGFGLTRIHNKISRLIKVISNIPIMLPGLFLGIALLGYFSFG